MDVGMCETNTIRAEPNFAQNQRKIITSSTDNVNILEHITNYVYEFMLRRECLVEDISNILVNTKNTFFECTINGSKNLDTAIDCFVHNEVYDEVMGSIKENFASNDLRFYEKCKGLCKMNVTPQQLGSKAYITVPKLAIVELSLIDNCKSPTEKLHCLSAVYDLIFAEMKASRIAIISQYSEKEIDIPVIETKEILPVLMSVIIKSKLMYVVSNFHYVRTFGKAEYENDKITRDILNVFEEVVEMVLKLKSNNLKNFLQLSPCLDVCETISFVSEHANDTSECEETFREEKRRIQGLITAATTHNLCNF